MYPRDRNRPSESLRKALMDETLRVLFIRWLMADRNIKRKELRGGKGKGKSKIDKLLSGKGYKHVTHEMLDDIEHNITNIKIDKDATWMS